MSKKTGFRIERGDPDDSRVPGEECYCTVYTPLPIPKKAVEILPDPRDIMIVIGAISGMTEQGLCQPGTGFVRIAWPECKWCNGTGTIQGAEVYRRPYPGERIP